MNILGQDTIEKPNIFKYTKKNIGKKRKRMYNTFIWKKIKMRYKYCSTRKKCKTFKIDKKCLKKKNK